MTLLFMPGSPALVRELAPRDESAAAIVSLLRKLIDEAAPTAIDIVGARDEHLRTAHVGSFAAWGKDVKVAAGEYLPELLAYYVLGKRWTPLVGDSRARIDAPRGEALTLVVLDGSAGLTPRAPLSLLPGAEEVHEFCRSLIAGEAADQLPEEELERWLREGGVVDPAPWLEVAVLSRRADLRRRCLVSEAPLGVGRYVGVWEEER